MSTEGAPQISPRETFTLLDLKLENIGPFDHAELTFFDREASEPQSPVTIITGENGAGKSIVIDAIRAVFGPHYALIKRPIWQPGKEAEHSIASRFLLEGADQAISSKRTVGLQFDLDPVAGPRLQMVPSDLSAGRRSSAPWVVDLWEPTMANDRHEISSFTAPAARDHMLRCMDGTYNNASITSLLVYFDYLRGSSYPLESRTGEVLYETARRIVALGLSDYELLEVERATFTPMIRQGRHRLPLASLSSGYAYVAQRMVGLLGRMSSSARLREADPEEICRTPGLLIIDEAEHHLHPRWQKRLLIDILDIFPNLQIIATTHSPFVTGSVPGARVYVCRYERDKRCSVVEDVTQDYADKPVEDILASAAFGETETFGKEITELLEQRRSAIQKRDEAERAKIEEKLYQRNPSYFNFLKLDEHLARLRGADE